MSVNVKVIKWRLDNLCNSLKMITFAYKSETKILKSNQYQTINYGREKRS